VRLSPCSSNKHGSRHALPHLAEYKLNPFRSNFGVSEVLLQLWSGPCGILLESEAGRSLVHDWSYVHGLDWDYLPDDGELKKKKFVAYHGPNNFEILPEFGIKQSSILVSACAEDCTRYRRHVPTVHMLDS
jgi:hypothetical protein